MLYEIKLYVLLPMSSYMARNVNLHLGLIKFVDELPYSSPAKNDYETESNFIR